MLAASPSAAETALSFAAIGDLLGEAADDVLSELPAPQRHALEVALLRAPPDRGEIGRRSDGSPAALYARPRAGPRQRWGVEIAARPLIRKARVTLGASAERLGPDEQE